MEFRAYIKNLRISPKKLRFYLDSIKNNNPVIAMEKLFLTPSKAAKLWFKAIKSAVDNAKESGNVDVNLLKFKLLTVEQGPVFKRFRPGGRGTVKPYKRRTAHIRIILETSEERLEAETKKRKESQKFNETQIQSTEGRENTIEENKDKKLLKRKEKNRSDVKNDQKHK